MSSVSHTVHWTWSLRSNHRWRWSTLASSLKWGLSFGLVYFVVSRTGHSWAVNTLVSLVMDGLLYIANQFIWRERQVSRTNSVTTTFIIWLMFLGLNAGLMWLLLHPANVDLTQARLLAVPFGVAMNFVNFRINDEVAFRKEGLRRLRRGTRAA